MASIPATITVDFISNYAGPHRVCWRTGGAGPYNCSTIVSCLGGAAPCSAIISITVDNESCDSIIFDGYVQATCQVDGSLIDRVPFTNTFVPVPSCAGYTITCESVGVAGAYILNPGSGYNPLSPPAVSIATGPGVGATATASVGDGGILTETITTGGAGYVDGVYLSVPAVTLTGVGSGALYDVVVVGGIVTTITLTDPIITAIEAGTGYAINDTFEFNNIDLGGAGTGVVITVDSLNTGMITFINITSAGSGYIAVPSVTVPAPGVGIQATFLGVLAQCGTYNAGANCDATVQPNIKLSLNSSTIVCVPVTPPAPDPTNDITIVQNACCYLCRSYFIDKTLLGTTQLIYTDCSTRQLIKTNITTITSFTICAVEGSVLIQEATPTTTVTPGLPC